MEPIRKYFCERDQLARHLGIELVELSAGHARARMTVQPMHMNGANVVHGGAIFSLADFAFAAASNSHGVLALSISATISIMKAVTEGTLEAEAKEVALNPKLGTYLVTVTDPTGETIALFQGIVYRKKERVEDFVKE